MATSKAEYHRNVLEQVLAAAGLRADKEHLPHDFLRRSVDALADHAELTAGVADFWLDLDQPTGAARRREVDPPSPFSKRHRALIAPKGKIAEWDLAWRKKEVAKILMEARSPLGADLAQAFLGKKQPMVMTWVDERELVVGAAGWLPGIARNLDPTQIDIRWMRPDHALRKPWLERSEAHQFLALLRAAQQLQADALETLQRDFNTAMATGTSDPQDGRL